MTGLLARVRICWHRKADEKRGNGEWFDPAEEKSLDTLPAWLNMTFIGTTHWLEWENEATA
tara:strand:- start:3959 stop:4141 length:183 start_codon:yes stop_codon:yes gene_type:complete